MTAWEWGSHSQNPSPHFFWPKSSAHQSWRKKRSLVGRVGFVRLGVGKAGGFSFQNQFNVVPQGGRCRSQTKLGKL